MTATVVTAGLAIVLTAGVANADEAVVARVVDRDTVDVRLDGRIERIRLLNVDTPETTDPDKPVECLGPEATDYLRMLLPVGTPVTLEYDVDRKDRYDRTLAAVFTPSGSMVNQEMTRAGLGTSVVYGDNDRFLSEVRAGQEAAALAGRGLFSADVACTLPGQVETVAAAVADAQPAEAQTSGMSSAELDSAAADVGAAAALVAALIAEFEKEQHELVWGAFTPRQRREFLPRLHLASQQAIQAGSALAVAANQARGLEVEAARLAAEAAAARAAAEAEAARVAAEAEAAALARQQRSTAGPAAKDQSSDATRPRTKAPVPKPAPVRKPAPAPEPGSGNPYPGYTGPRCYAPGGKTWKPCP